ncbi:O-antigen ligase family protein [Actinoplanes sp. NPDC051851]|uniref:O-antigen ligase family protein n=1 Tax=Actinoplanes sp. NPDC051851 TaxID=3154753 RepID=UPI0034371BB0
MALAASEEPAAGQEEEPATEQVEEPATTQAEEPVTEQQHEEPAAEERDERAADEQDEPAAERHVKPVAAAWPFVISLLTSPTRAVTAFLVGTLGLVPVALFPRDTPIYSGIANTVPTVYNYTIAIVVAAAVVGAMAPRMFRTALKPWAPFLIWAAVMTVAVWGLLARDLSGLLQLGLGMLAFGIGVVSRWRERFSPLVPQLFALVAWGQLAAVLLAVAGLPLRTITGPQAIDIHGRATGLTAHPGELSKLLFFCGICVLMLPQRTRRERWTVWATLGAVFTGVFLTESRTILVAVIGMVVLFMLIELSAGRWQRRHLTILGLTGLLGLASLPWLISRFMADPTGGDRGHLMVVAFRAIGDHFLAGVGPNSYVAVVGLTDELTSTGVPVHNTFLLTAAELGVPGAILLWLPAVVVVVRAVRATIRTRGSDQAARVIVAATPGILLISLTGWGLLQGPYFAIFLLVLGYFGAWIGTAAPEQAAVEETPEEETPVVEDPDERA